MFRSLLVLVSLFSLASPCLAGITPLDGEDLIEFEKYASATYRFRALQLRDEGAFASLGDKFDKFVSAIFELESHRKLLSSGYKIGGIDVISTIARNKSTVNFTLSFEYIKQGERKVVNYSHEKNEVLRDVPLIGK